MRFSGMRHERHRGRPHGHEHGHEHGERPVYAIEKERCIGCGSCLQACKYGAISGSQGQAHRIAPEKCVGCGHCARACRYEAIKSTV